MAPNEMPDAPPPTSSGTLVSGLRQLYGHLSRRRQAQLVLVFVIILAGAVSEVVSIGMVVPFLAILVAPDRAMANPKVAGIASWLGVNSPQGLLVPLVAAFLAAIIIAGGVRLLALYATTRFATRAGTELAIDLFRRTLHAPFMVHLTRHSSEVVSAMTKKVDGVVNGVMIPALQFASSLVVLIFISVTLLLLNPVVALVAFASLGIAYLVLSLFTGRTMRAVSAQTRKDASSVVKLLTEAMNGIRDILMSRSQRKYVAAFSTIDHRLRQSGAKIIMISQGARHVMEIFAIILIVALAYTLATSPAGASAAIPTLGALALGGQRMLPALQQMFSSWSTMTATHGFLDDVLILLRQPEPKEAKPAGTISFDKSLELRNVSFSFPGTDKLILDNVTLSIPKGASVGLIGETGSGKSTLANIVMGLLPPSAGQLLIDGESIGEATVAGWQARIAYVPQSIYLLDASFEDNIAIGNAMAPLDRDLVRRAAEDAQIASIADGRREGFAAKVGENGVQLSGGQRQRVGIARALYKRGDFLILDEATSALDGTTEAAVMDAIGRAMPRVTMLIIAHRLTTLRHCDLIVRLGHGRVEQVGTFAEVIGEAA